LKQICNGFKEVHRKKIIHRDVKPANFLIHKGVVKIADFGFARVVDSVNEKAILTFLGSPLYMAPQVLAKEEFSSKCDVWSLGVTIYEILYGKTPFTAKNPKELLERLRNEQLTFP
jgi:serine/threonine-protein kinase ULK/ATG1